MDSTTQGIAAAVTSFEVGPYRCIALAESAGPAQPHVGAALVRREQADGTRETRLTFAEEDFDTAAEAMAYAAARADFLLRFEPASVVPF